MKKIGVPVISSGDNWIGGLNYFISLASAINACKQDKYKFVFITNDKSRLSSVDSVNISVVQWRILSSRNIFVRLVKKIFGESFFIGICARFYGVDYLTHCISPLFWPKAKALFWMPDFQHKYLSNLFSKKEMMSRDYQVEMAIKSGSILFSSMTASEDFSIFFAHGKQTKVYTLPFVPSLCFDADSISNSVINKECGNLVFFLPNQFWKHKNHIVVVEALSMLPNNYKVFCTGAVDDYRGSEHIARMFSRISELNLSDRFNILGLVSRDEFVQLLRGCVAVINPSLFEGWSTTVEEAKAFGKQIVLSDIKIHREQNPDFAFFFEPNSPESLAAAMRKAAEKYSHDEDVVRFDSAKSTYANNQYKFAKNYFDILDSFTSNQR